MNLAIRAAAVPIALVVLALGPFLDKAFTVDDAVFLLEARHALTDPLHPTAFSMAWTSEVPERVSTMVPSGPVAAWLLMPAVAAGGVEWLAHAVQVVFLALAALGTVSIAMRLGLTAGWAAAAGLLLVTTPVTLGMAGTAMPDVPAMSLGIVGLERMVAWHQEGGRRRALCGAVLLALAPLTRSHLAALLVLGPLLLGADHLFHGDRSRSIARVLWPFGLAAAIAAVILLVTRDPDPGSGGLLSSAASLSNLENIGYNALSFATHWVLATTFALAWIALRAREITRRWWIWVAASLAFAARAWLAGPDASYWIVPVAGLGVTALLDALLDAVERRDGLQLALGAWLLASLPVAIYTPLPAQVPHRLHARGLPPRRPGWPSGRPGSAGGWWERRPRRGSCSAPPSCAPTPPLPRWRGPGSGSSSRRSCSRGARSGTTATGHSTGTRRRPAHAPGRQPFLSLAPAILILTNAVRPIPLDASSYRALVHLRRYEDRTPGGARDE